MQTVTLNNFHDACGAALVRINGRTLANNLKRIARSHPFASFSLTSWVNACPQCHVSWLGIDANRSLPFLCADDVMRTSHDFTTAPSIQADVIDFCGFKFSYAALDSAIHLQLQEFNTSATEKFAKTLSTPMTEEEAKEFSERVCIWGGGARVWANLNRRNPEGLPRLLKEWLETARQDDVGDEEALTGGIEIQGLSVSFASKHLRMLRPDRFAVLDAVLSDGLGFALNLKGYNLYMHYLRELHQILRLRESSRFSHDVATLEAGLFLLVRQRVRSDVE